MPVLTIPTKGFKISTKDPNWHVNKSSPTSSKRNKCASGRKSHKRITYTKLLCKNVKDIRKNHFKIEKNNIQLIIK